MSLVQRGVVPAAEANRIPDALRWTLNTRGNPSAVKDVLDLDKYMHLEGMVYRLLPYEAYAVFKGIGGVNEDKSYEVLVNKAKWGNLEKDNVVVDRESMRNSTFAKNDYMRLAEACIQNKHNKRAVTVLDTYFKYFPLDKFPPDVYTLAFKDKYYEAGATDKGMALAKDIYRFYLQELDYINSLSPAAAKTQVREHQTALAVLQDIATTAQEYKQTDFYKEVNSRFEEEVQKYYGK